MATFYYRALTDDGRIVSNKVEEGNRLTLVNKLKENGLHPISIQQRNAKRTKVLKKKKRNIEPLRFLAPSLYTEVLPECMSGGVAAYMERIIYTVYIRRKRTGQCPA